MTSVLRLTLNRPNVRNAFDEEVIAALTAAATAAAADPGIRAVVLAGAGSVFCAGADLGWMAKAIAYTERENLNDAEDLARMLERIDTLPMPIIGRIQGAALGGGVGLAAVCDIVVAADDAVFALSEVKLGILPGGDRSLCDPRRSACPPRANCSSPAPASTPRARRPLASCTRSCRRRSSMTRSSGGYATCGRRVRVRLRWPRR